MAFLQSSKNINEHCAAGSQKRNCPSFNLAHSSLYIYIYIKKNVCSVEASLREMVPDHPGARSVSGVANAGITPCF